MTSQDESILDIDADAEPAPIPELDVVLEPQPAVEPAKAAEPKRPSMLFLVGSLVGGNGISLVLKMLGGILQARCVLPSVLGMFNSMGLVLGYAPFLQLGVLNGINRELPYFIGKGDRGRVNELAAAAQAWAMMVGCFVGGGLAGAGIWQLYHGQGQLAVGWFTYAVLGVLLFYNTYYLQMTYRTAHDFARLAVSSVIENSVALVLVGLVALFSFYGICLRSLLTAVVSATFLHYWRPVRVGLYWDRQHLRNLKHLLVIGAPIFIVGQVYAWWTVLNSTLVYAYMGDEGMGLYALVLVGGGAMELVPTAVGQVIYPRMAEQYGRTGRLGDLLRMSVKPTIFSVLCMIPAVLVGWWLVEPVIRLILRNYVGAVPAIRWSLLVALVQCLVPISNVYNVVRRQDLYIVAILLGMGAYVGSLLWLVRGGATLAAFPQAMLIGRVVFALMCYVMVVFLRSGRAARI
jgi:O-antigen/teichoic acid export membrane protein